MTKTHEIRPQPGFQNAFASCRADIAIGGGAAGAGKSWGLVYEASRWYDIPRYRALLLRKHLTDIRGGDGLWDLSQQICPHLGGRPREQALRWMFNGGQARIDFGHMESVGAWRRYMGQAFAFIGIDELTHFTARQFWALYARNRTMSRVRPYMRATCNPDPDHFVRDLIDWWIGSDGFPILERAGVLRYFVRIGDDMIWADSLETLRDAHPKLRPQSLTFIPGMLEDNPEMLRHDPEYEAKLMALPYVERMQLRYGNWNVRPAAGLYFRDEFFPILDRAPTDTIKKVRSWDLAGTKAKPSQSEETGPAWTAGALMSRGSNGVIIIEDMERFRGSPGEVEERVRRVADIDGRKVEVAIWQDPGQAGKDQMRNYSRVLSGYNFKSVVARQDKITYAGPLSSAAEHGNVRIVRGAWNRAFLSEAHNFPLGRFKDQIDGTSLGMLRLTGKRGRKHRKRDPDVGYTGPKWQA